MRRLYVALSLLVGNFAFAEPPHHGEHEILNARPSGFWTSNAPAVGGAYKYNLMYVGLAVLAITGFFTYRLLRRARSV